MSNQRPLVLDPLGSGDMSQLGRLQSPNDLDIPLQAAHDNLERRFRLLLADYTARFGIVPALADETPYALAQG